MAMALTSLLDPAPEAAPQPWILNKLQDLMTFWTDVLAECLDLDDDDGSSGEQKDLLVYEDRLEQTPYDSPEDVRKREVCMPVFELLQNCSLES